MFHVKIKIKEIKTKLNEDNSLLKRQFTHVITIKT